MGEPCRCDVVGCARWTRRFPSGSGYLCPAHWPLVPTAWKRARTALRKRAAGNAFRVWRINKGTWRRMVARANERAAGI